MKQGTLYVVSTPIGNLDDITVRAVEILRNSDVIACEDTRKTRILTAKWGIKAGLVSLHKFSEARKTRSILEKLENGLKVALVSDAGTPGISDPGSRIVRAALDAGFTVTPIPGPSSVTAALSASGMEGSSFVFHGFTPRKKEAKIGFFETLAGEKRTSLFLETPARIETTLAAASVILGPRRMVLMRELTKIHEEIIAGPASELLARLQDRPSIKGEIIVVVEGGTGADESVDLSDAVKTLMQEGLSGKRLADEAARRYGVRKGDAYDMFLDMASKDHSGEPR